MNCSQCADELFAVRHPTLAASTSWKGLMEHSLHGRSEEFRIDAD
jgi:hypothetical protein